MIDNHSFASCKQTLAWSLFIAVSQLYVASNLIADDTPLPELPTANGTVDLPTQPILGSSEPRTVKAYIHYPSQKLDSVTPQTGLMLSLHNWGGTYHSGAPEPNRLANRFNVVVICVDYLDSGKAWKNNNRGYDFGALQAIDALRSLHCVYSQLQQKNIPFHNGRIYSTGGSGGGNVTLMVNKFAPRTFACIVDMCGMARLTDDIAFNEPGGSFLNAMYSRDEGATNYLSPDAQAIRFIGHPDHVATMKQLGNSCQIISVHGEDDVACLAVDKHEMIDNMKKAGLTVEAHFLTKDKIDGKVFKSTGHSMGNRDLIVTQVGDQYMKTDSPTAAVRSGLTDFDRRDEQVRYATPNGAYVISYKQGLPEIRFESN